MRRESFQDRELVQYWTYLDQVKKILGSFRIGKLSYRGVELEPFSAFRLARRELGGELAIYSQVLGKPFLAEGFLFFGTEIKQDVHTGR